MTRRGERSLCDSWASCFNPRVVDPLAKFKECSFIHFHWRGFKIFERVTWPRPRPFQVKFFTPGVNLPYSTHLPNLKSVASSIAEILKESKIFVAWQLIIAHITFNRCSWRCTLYVIHTFIRSFVSLIMPPTTRNGHTTSNHYKQKPNPKLKITKIHEMHTAHKT